VNVIPVVDVVLIICGDRM